MEKDEAYDRVIKMMEAVINDRTVPRNIRNAVEEAKKEVQKEGVEEEVKLAAAVQILDEITNDPNMPLYTRTQIWNIVTQLEELRRMATKK